MPAYCFELLASSCWNSTKSRPRSSFADTNAGVFDFDAKVAGAVGHDPHADFAVFRGEFERVGNVIVKNLLQAARVGVDRHERRINLGRDFDAF